MTNSRNNSRVRYMRHISTLEGTFIDKISEEGYESHYTEIEDCDSSLYSNLINDGSKVHNVKYSYVVVDRENPEIKKETYNYFKTYIESNPIFTDICETEKHLTFSYKTFATIDAGNAFIILSQPFFNYLDKHEKSCSTHVSDATHYLSQEFSETYTPNISFAISGYFKTSEAKSDFINYLRDNNLITLIKCPPPVSYNNAKFYYIERDPTSGRFYLSSKRFEQYEVDIDKLYNDNVVDYYNAMQSHFDNKESGLSIIKGPPGTGKSSMLMKMMEDNPGTKFIYCDSSIVSHINSPDFTKFLYSISNSVLILEDQEEIVQSRSTGQSHPAISNLLNITSGVIGKALNLTVLITFNYERSTSIDIDAALLRKGRIIGVVDVNPLSLEKTKNLAKDLGINPDDFTSETTLADIYNHSKNVEFTENKRSGISLIRDTKKQ